MYVCMHIYVCMCVLLGLLGTYTYTYTYVQIHILTHTHTHTFQGRTLTDIFACMRSLNTHTSSNRNCLNPNDNNKKCE